MSTETISTNTTAEVIYTPEESLPAVSAAQVKQLRALNHDGQSVNTTTDALREMVGMDYSLLTEQVVPGEYWRGMDGVKKQVYVRTFVVSQTMSTIIGGLAYWGIVLTPGVCEVIKVGGYKQIQGQELGILTNWKNAFMWYCEVASDGSLAIGGRAPAADINKSITLNINVKYTKR